MSITANSTKTPVGTLQELCVKYREGAPFYEVSGEPTDPTKLFIYKVTAFNHMAVGSGRSKKEAKHESAVNLINILKEIPTYKDDLVNTPDTPKQIVDSDAVGTLLDICVQRNLPMALFTILQASGQAHSPNFTVECRVSSIVRCGNFSTKRGAKQIAAQEILKVLQNLPQDEENMQIATLEQEPPEKIIKTYREFKNSDIKPDTGIKLSNRHQYFEKFSITKISACKKIMDNPFESSEEKLHLISKELQFRYAISDATEFFQSGKRLMFEMFGDFDLIRFGTPSDIHDNVLIYIKTMMNI